MGKNKTPENIKAYQFSELYYKKKEKIQEANHYEFIEFLNWVENVNKGKKKEEGKELVDLRFNKYSNGAILWLFNQFVKFKKRKSKGYTYETILNEAKKVLKTEVYGENIVKPLFGYYGNYLKYLMRKEGVAALGKVVNVNVEGAKKLRKQKKNEVIDTLKAVDEGAANHYGGDDRDIVNEDGDVVPNPNRMHIPQELIVEPEDEEERRAGSEEGDVEEEDKIYEDAKNLKGILEEKINNMEKEAVEKCELIKGIDLEVKNLCVQLRKLKEGERRLDHFNEVTKVVGRLNELLNKRVETGEDLLKIISGRNECVGKLMDVIAVLNKKYDKYHWQETEAMKSINGINHTTLEFYNDSLRDIIKEWRERLDSKEPKQLDLDFDY